jgi:hypothetical protein
VRIDFKEPDVDFFDGTSLFPASKAYYDRVGEKEFAVIRTALALTGLSRTGRANISTLRHLPATTASS